jgi:hypothetical protein
MAKKTHSKFIEDLKIKNYKAYRSLTFISEYVGAKSKIYATDKYGKVSITPTKLLSGSIPNISSAINKHEYFIEMLRERNPCVLKNFTFIGKYEKSIKKIKMMSKYGVVAVTPNGLLSGVIPNFTSAVDKTKYFINNSNDIHNYKFKYSRAKFVSAKKKLIITCRIHNDFLQTPDGHLSQKQGCPKCAGKYGGKYRDVPRYNKYSKYLKSIGIKCKRNMGDESILEVECYKCGKFFRPKLEPVIKKIYYSKKIGTENNLYCSDNCKETCQVYGFHPNYIDKRLAIYVSKTEQDEIRACQTTSLKENQCDNKGHNYCEKCGDIIDVELHHTLEVAKHGKDAINSAGHILLCAGCHVKLHREC